MEVRCINDWGVGSLTHDKKYIVEEIREKEYLITNDRDTKIWYEKSRFEKVSGDIIMVECVENDMINGGKLTINKKYPVLKIEDGLYLIKDDLGQTLKLAQSRFKLVEKPIQEINGIEFYKNGNIKVSISKEEYEKNVEGEKVEEVIKVRCKRNGFDFEKDETYKAEKTITGAYKLMNDKGVYHIFFGTDFSNYFEKVTDDVLMVECIDNKEFEGDLSKGEKYKVIEDSGVNFKVKNDRGNVRWYRKNRFKLVEPQKEEKKEYSVMELFEEKEGIEYKIEGLDNLYKVENGILRRSVDKGFYETMYCDKTILKAKFTKAEEPKPVSFIEAWKAKEEQERPIKSVISDRILRKGCFDTVGTDEMENLWIIL